MKIKPVKVSLNEKKVWSVSVPGVGEIFFSDYDAAMKLCSFLNWLDQLETGQPIWLELEEAGQETLWDSGNPALHDIMTSLMVLSFVLAAAGVVQQMHLAMIRKITERLEKALEKASKAQAAKQPPKLKNPTPGM